MQEPLPGMMGRPARRQDDYHGLFPRRVRPTGGLEVLERGSNLLFIKTYGPDTDISEAQNRIWQLMSSISNVTDAPGNITVACVWGLAEQPRVVYVYDYRGDGPAKTMTRDEWRRWLYEWWEDNG